VFRYVDFLKSEGRPADALLVAETAAKLPQRQDSNGGQLRDLITSLKQSANAKPASQ